jgi:ribosomal protein S18 acetylase RimI-like enzyme
MTTSIRRARPEDSSVLCTAEKFWASKPGHLVSHPQELKEDSFAGKIDQLAQNPKGIYLVAESDTKVILGHAFLDPMGLNSISHIVRLTIVVHPGFEGKGVGHLLMESLVSWAKSSDSVEKIELLVRATNTQAIQLYKRFGFVEEGRLRNRIKIDDDTYIDDLTMGLLLE